MLIIMCDPNTTNFFNFLYFHIVQFCNFITQTTFTIGTFTFDTFLQLICLFTCVNIDNRFGILSFTYETKHCKGDTLTLGAV